MTTTNTPLKFTVIIPTRERADVLRASLRTAVMQDYDNLEIIVSDNFSGDDTKEVVQSFSDPRITYINTGKRLAMSDNWEFALSHVAHGWVVVVGDDDGLLPGGLKRVAELITATGTDAVRSNSPSYLWPSVVGRGYGRLYVSLRTGHEGRDSRPWLRKVMLGDARYTDLPMLYQGGFVEFDVLKAIRAKCGRFFQSSIPDVYSAVAIASVLPKYVFSHDPFTIAGQSRHSGGASMFADGMSADAMTPAKVFAAEPNIPFHRDLPLSVNGIPASIQAIVYESYLQSRILRGEPNGEITPQQQLRVILSSDDANRKSVREWSKSFAALHGLKVDRIAAEARAARVMRAVRRAPARAWNTFNTISVGSPDLPIVDVYEASLLAEAICARRPSRLTNNVAKIQRRLALG